MLGSKQNLLDAVIPICVSICLDFYLTGRIKREHLDSPGGSGRLPGRCRGCLCTHGDGNQEHHAGTLQARAWLRKGSRRPPREFLGPPPVALLVHTSGPPPSRRNSPLGSSRGPLSSTTLARSRRGHGCEKDAADLHGVSSGLLRLPCSSTPRAPRRQGATPPWAPPEVPSGAPRWHAAGEGMVLKRKPPTSAGRSLAPPASA